MKGQSLTADVITGRYIKCDNFYERDMLGEQGPTTGKVGDRLIGEVMVGLSEGLQPEVLQREQRSC